MIARVQGWLTTRNDRERRLVALAAGVTLAALVGAVALAVHDDLATLRARVAAHERELALVRRLAAMASGASPGTGDDSALITRLQAAADAARLTDRVVAMTPADVTTAGGPSNSGLTVRVGGASLAETVHLLHVLDEEAAPLGVARFALRKHLDDPHRFDVTLEIAGGGP